MSQQLAHKKIILCITGSIAAYKAAFLVRLLIKSQAEVRVIMTPSACAFISPLTLSTLSKHDVHTEVSDGNSWNNHVELGLWADAMLVAPMWKHPSTKSNLSKLSSYGDQIIPVGNGELASGLSGEGRMAEPEDIVAFLARKMSQEQDLAGKTILVTAGPTHEALDPVRFIGNRSSGKMGIAIAEECAHRGADVKLVLGPSALQAQHSHVETIKVTSAQDMFEAATSVFDQCDAAIMAAAVADYTPETVSDIKIKKKEGDLSIPLKRTKDIAKYLGQQKKHQLLIGFALETNNEISNANRKLQKKNLDFIVLNSLNDRGAGFQHDTNKIKIIKSDDEILDYPLKSKTAVAVDIVDQIVKMMK